MISRSSLTAFNPYLFKTMQFTPSVVFCSYNRNRTKRIREEIRNGRRLRQGKCGLGTGICNQPLKNKRNEATNSGTSIMESFDKLQLRYNVHGEVPNVVQEMTSEPNQTHSHCQTRAQQAPQLQKCHQHVSYNVNTRNRKY
jgi:hypothetical protein